MVSSLNDGKPVYQKHLNGTSVALEISELTAKMVCPTGIEPVTHSLEGCCSIQLSYGQKLQKNETEKALTGLWVLSVLRKTFKKISKNFNLRNWSERRDSNSRPSAPKADALPGCATLRQGFIVTRDQTDPQSRVNLSVGPNVNCLV